MLTRRGRLALALGAVSYLGAWAFGAEPLYPVAVGLVLTVVLASAWVRVLNRPMELHRSAWGGRRVEGEDVEVELELVSSGRLVPSSVTVVERLARLGERQVDLVRSGKRLYGLDVLRALPRGRYRSESAHAILEDPFGLARIDVPLDSGGAVLVYPRLVELDRLFSEAGRHGSEGRRLLLRRPTGFDLHSVREYERGESLRKVHWKTTARRGQLMVKELEDAPRDEVAILLDAHAGSVAGSPPESSFDMQVRATTAILRAHVRRGRSAVLVVNSLERASQRVRADEHEWLRALDVLAAVEPDGQASASALLAEDASPAGRAIELAVVTARLPPELVDRLVQRAGGRRGVSLVYVDAPSFARRVRTRDPALLRLQAAGIPVAVLRKGDDLSTQLGAAQAEASLHA